VRPGIAPKTVPKANPRMMDKGISQERRAAAPREKSVQSIMAVSA
jgi:hypothetical protein